MYGQMTAGSWIYIGTQGILQGTYETFAAVAAKRFGGTLAGTLTVTGGCGGMGGAQPLAVTLNDGVCLVIDVDPARLHRRVEQRYLDMVADDLGSALRLCLAAKNERKALSVGLVGNCATVLPELLRRGVEVDIVTDQTSAHDPLSYLPEGRVARRLARLRGQEADGVHRTGACFDGQARRGHGRVHGRRRRGVRLRQLDQGRGAARRLRAGVRVPRVRARLHQAAVRRGEGPVPLGGAVRRPGRHPRHRRGGAVAVPRTTTTCTSGSGPRRSGSRSRGCPPGSAGSATASGTPPGWRSTTWSRPGKSARPSSSAATTWTRAPSPPPTGRPSRWPTDPTRSPTGRCSTR